MPAPNRPRRQLLTLTLAAALPPASAAVQPLALHLPNPEAYSTHGQFFVEVLMLALRKTADGEPPATLSYAPVDLPRERLRQLLHEGQLDLLWSTTTPEREAQALPVRVNLMKGINELRFLLVRAADLPALRPLRTLEQLRRLRAGAGAYWSDALILRANGFVVETAPKFDSLFRMLKAGRFDFMPRTREEIDVELQFHADQGFAELPGLALQYRQPLYFFVSPQRPQLADRLRRGLALAMADGSFEALFMAEPGLKTALAQARAYSGLRLQLRALGDEAAAPL